jgi:hypothetical protein
MNFFIKKNSTLPKLIYPLTQKVMEQGNITYEMLNNVAVTFSMQNLETGIYKIANVSANLIKLEYSALYEEDLVYALMYKFTQNNTNLVGNFNAEFVLDFLDPQTGCGKLKLPIDDVINVVINDAITKTTVV